jgi:hypothetical protein
MSEAPPAGVCTALGRLLGALRRPASEVQLSQALAAFAASDAAFASGLATVFVAHAPAERRAALGPIPPELLCDAEFVLEGGGRVDLRFEDQERRFGLLVELKIGAGYGGDQLDKYLRAADELGYEHIGLTAVTKSPPWYGEESVSSDVRWLGSARWSRIFVAMRTLRHAELDLEWSAFLDVVRYQGDFGVVTLDREAVRGWARYREGSGILRSLLEELAAPALDVIRSQTGSDDDVAASLKKGASPVWTWNDRVHLRFAIPGRAAPEERLRIQFFAYAGRVHFCVEARYPDARPLLDHRDRDEQLCEITAALAAMSPPFKQGHDWESYWTRWHSMEHLIDQGDNPVEQLLAWVREDVRDLAGMGLFNALQEVSQREPRAPQTAHDE